MAKKKKQTPVVKDNWSLSILALILGYYLD